MKRGIASHETPNEGATNTWLTPRWIIEALGPFDLDPCAATEEPARVATRYFTVKDNGLAQDWGDAYVFCNPPYGPHTGPWLGRCAQHGHAIALVFARTDTGPLQTALRKCDAALFIAGRLTFDSPPGGQESRGNAGAPSVLLAYGRRARQRLADSDIPGSLMIALDRRVYALPLLDEVRP